jgi:hypothetical protein
VNLKPKVPLSGRLSPITLTEVIATAGVVSPPSLPPQAASSKDMNSVDANGARYRMSVMRASQ